MATPIRILTAHKCTIYSKQVKVKNDQDAKTSQRWIPVIGRWNEQKEKAREIETTKLHRSGQYKEDLKITVGGVPMRVQKCMAVDKRTDEYPREFLQFPLLLSLYLWNMLHVRSLTREEKTSSEKFSPLPRYLHSNRQTAIFIGPRARYVSRSMYPPRSTYLQFAFQCLTSTFQIAV